MTMAPPAEWPFRGDGGDDFSFLDGAQNGIGGVGAARLHTVHAVLEVADVAGGAAVDGEAAEGAGISQAARIDPGGEVEDPAGVPLVERHAREVLAVHDGAGGGGFRLKQRSRGGHLDRFGHCADLEHDVDRQRGADAKLQVVPQDALETGGGDDYFVISRAEEGDAVEPFRVGFGVRFKRSGCMNGGDLGSGYHRAGGIRNGSADSGETGLTNRDAAHN